MRKKRKISVILLCLFFILITGCRTNTPVNVDNTEKINQKKASVYYINSDGNNLIKKDIDISEVRKEEILSFLIDKMIENPDEEGMKSALRTGTKCIWIKNEGNIVSVNFSKEFYNDESIKDTLSMGAVVKTLCSLEKVQGVKIFIENNILKTKDNKEILKDTDFVFDTDSLESDEDYITLYFSDENGENLISEVRKVTVPKGEVKEKLVVSELLKGPKELKNLQVIPSGTKILSVETTDEVCYVNFSKEIIEKHPGGTYAEIMTIYSIVNSLTELSNINKVQFLIDGEIREVFKHIMINEPLERDITYIIK